MKLEEAVLRRLPFEIRRRPDPNLALYELLYGDVRGRPFVNLGAGGFRHPAWRNIDHSNDWYTDEHAIDIDLDFLDQQPIPIADGTIALAYCSHVVEHLGDVADTHLLAEAKRILAPNGLLRLVTPDAQLILDAYHRGDAAFFEIELLYPPQSLEQHLLMSFASSLTAADTEYVPKLSDDAVRDLVAEGDEVFLRTSTGLCDTHYQRSHPGQHLNWWTVERLIAACEAAGFRRAWRSAYGQSNAAVMRDLRWFDTSHPSVSLYVEAAV